MIPEKEHSIIRICYNKSVHPKALAKYYKASLEEILDILELPHDLKKMEKLHREKNFYDHGFGDALDRRMQTYGVYLHDGDFEKYQKYCYMSHWNPMFWIMKWRIFRIKKTGNPTADRRRIWLRHRFVEYQGKEWSEGEDEAKELNKMIFPKNPYII